MAKAKTPTPMGGYRDGDGMGFTWNRNVPPAYDHFDLAWGVYYSGTWDEASGRVDNEGKDPLSYFVHGFNQTGSVTGYGNFATSSYVKKFSPEDWYPFQNRICSAMWYKVRGDTAAASASTPETRSAWSEASLLRFQAPSAPAATASRSGGSTTLTWRSPDSGRGMAYCTEAQVQTRLGSGAWVTLDADVTWPSGTSATSGDWGDPSGDCTVTESQATQAGTTPLTRSYRVRCRGPMGASAWTVVDAWTWAKPNAPSAWTRDSGRDASSDKLSWTYSPEGGRPAEELVVERCTGTPTTAADGLPQNPSWTESAPVANPSKGVTPVPLVPLGDDECVWMRAVASHGVLSTASNVVVTHRGRLAAPTGLSASSAQSGGTVTVTLSWTNATTVPGARADVYRRGAGDRDWTPVKSAAATASGGMSTCTIEGVPAGTVWDYRVEASKDGWTTSAAAVLYNMGRPGRPTIEKLTYDEDGGFAWVRWDQPDAATASVELAWSTDGNAWWSTEGYSSKSIEGRPTNHVIDSGIEPGATVRVRVRWLDSDGKPGDWSAIAEVLCATTPAKPVLQASRDVVKPGDDLGFAWSYGNADGSPLLRSVLHVTRNGTRDYPVGNGATQGTIWNNRWADGDSVSATVTVTSANGVDSEESDPVDVRVVAVPSPDVEPGTGSAESWEELPYVSTTVDGETAKVRTLSAPPLVVRVTGGGDGGSVTIRRAGTWRAERSDGTVDSGAEGERVASAAYSGATGYAVFHGVLLQDGGTYVAEARADNDAGSGGAVSEPFRVEWSNQADAPAATAAADGLGATVTATSSDSREMCDVYRLTADGPQLVLANAEWGAPVSDPYAPLGKHGATHRAVSRTWAGDEAWTDVDAGNPAAGIVVDWDGKRVSLPYNGEFSGGYAKRYESTRHRGGTVTGKWLEGVERTAEWSSDVIKVSEQGKLLLLRELARWCGECYLRGPGGVGFPCNVEVSFSAGHNDGAVGVSLSASRIDSGSWGGSQ